MDHLRNAGFCQQRHEHDVSLLKSPGALLQYMVNAYEA